LEDLHADDHPNSKTRGDRRQNDVPSGDSEQLVVSCTRLDLSPNVKIPVFQVPARLSKDRRVSIGFRLSGQHRNDDRSFLGVDNANGYLGGRLRTLSDCLYSRGPHLNPITASAIKLKAPASKENFRVFFPGFSGTDLGSEVSTTPKLPWLISVWFSNKAGATVFLNFQPLRIVRLPRYRLSFWRRPRFRWLEAGPSFRRTVSYFVECPSWHRGARVVPISVLDLQSLGSGPALKTFRGRLAPSRIPD
jgi:hypothetical protein